MERTLPYFRYFEQKTLNVYLRPRAGESKIGEHIALPQPDGRLPSPAPRFVLIGVPEDVGVRANLGMAGAAGAWEAFLKAFLNLQENRFLSGKDFLVLGALELPVSWMALPADPVEVWRNRTAEIDAALAPVVQSAFDAGCTPIIVGGGHNNAFPILQAAFHSGRDSLNVINIDPHTDFRAAEGRHSGNGFRYAWQEGYLKKYALLGLHEGYNAEPVLEEICHNTDFLTIFWEDIFLRKKLSPEQAIMACVEHVTRPETAPSGIPHKRFGVELDIDSIEYALSSAATPLGLSPRLGMDWLYQLGNHPQAAYLHLPEATVIREDGLHGPFTGKLLSYLVQAFCKGVLAQKPGGAARCS